MNKRKIINDPVYGFINITSEVIFDIIEHPWFQRMRRIKQLGLTNLVYPAANHSRFQHALGTYYLMQEAIQVIRTKGQAVSDEEAEAAYIAILLHDIGHGPFSHALEHGLVEGANHEKMSLLFLQSMNRIFDQQLETAIRVFTNQYKKRYLHQLIAGQLDMDRMDYLKRDSFFTGVSEGIIGSERIIKMLAVHNDSLVIEAKGIYSVEKFLIARRLMYWQVYLHKTVLSAEYMLINILRRAKELALAGESIFTTPSIAFFLQNHITVEHAGADQIIEHFAALDDNDIITSIKQWTTSSDAVLPVLCNGFLNRKLYQIELSGDPIDPSRLDELKKDYRANHDIPESLMHYFIFTGQVENNPYNLANDRIQVLFNNGRLADLSEVSDIFQISTLTAITKKYFLCYPKKTWG